MTRATLTALACSDGADYLRAHPEAREAWESCTRGNWLLWALGKLGYADERVLRLMACAIVRETPLGDGRTVWDLLTDSRSREAIEVAERYARGEATQEELDRAADGASRRAFSAAFSAAADVYAAASAAAAVSAAASAAATYAAVYAAASAAASASAAAAAYANAYAAASAAASAAQADIVRRFVPWEAVAGLIEEDTP
jgi:hypothetical protein